MVAFRFFKPRAFRNAPFRTSVVLGVLTLLFCASASASAIAAPVWHLDAAVNSTVAPGATLDYFLNVSNNGDEPTDGTTPYTLTIRLPAGISGASLADVGAWTCSNPAAASTITCTTAAAQAPGAFPRGLIVATNIDANASGSRTASVTVSGGAGEDAAPALPTNSAASTNITSAAPAFGVDAFDGQVNADAAGDPFTQAGGHPYSIATEVDFNTFTNPLDGPIWPVAPAKDLLVDLPPGIVGNPTTVEQCSVNELASPAGDVCPVDSQVGIVTVTASKGDANGLPFVFSRTPLRSLVPPPNVPARFGFNLAGTIVTLDAQVRSGGDYGLSVNVRDISEGLAVAKTGLTFWGVPADPSHDSERFCPSPIPGEPLIRGCPSTAPLKPFLRLPTSCTPAGTGLQTTLHADSWFEPGVFHEASFTSHLPPNYPLPPSERGAPQGATGCAAVPFEPQLTFQPSTPAIAGAPAGYSLDLTLPQPEDPTGIGEADLKKSVITFPAGLRVSPSAADGLGSCSEAQLDLHSEDDPSCPDSSKLGTVRIETPLLKEPLNGAIYLATPNDNPFHSLLAIYLVAKGPGLVVKLAGSVAANPTTGQLTSTFDDNPQLPFSRLKLQFFGGPRAALLTPSACGTYTTTSELTPWSAPSGPPATPSDSFKIDEGCHPHGFSPSVMAGTENNQAGAFSAFTVAISRNDSEQDLRRIPIQTPPGLLGRHSPAFRCAANPRRRREPVRKRVRSAARPSPPAPGRHRSGFPSPAGPPTPCT